MNSIAWIVNYIVSMQGTISSAEELTKQVLRVSIFIPLVWYPSKFSKQYNAMTDGKSKVGFKIKFLIDYIDLE